MPVSRRRFMERSAHAAAAAAAAPFVAPSAPPAAVSAAATPDWPVVALRRMGFGPRPGDIARVQGMGLTAYVDEQLNPAAIDDSACDAVLAAALLRIKYNADDDGMGHSYPARDAAVPLSLLGESLPNLWPRADFRNVMDWQERVRPLLEVKAATWLRAIYSKRQLAEVLADFWHNHFNVNGASEAAIAATFPVYDRDVIRANMLGNFRAMLEAVARSTAMMYSLDNVSNRTGGGEGGNENYARELLELHTLGSDNYLKFYDDRRQIGTVSYNGVLYARGYIDDDVYEAARCFSGWTIRNGYYTRPALNDGTFYYDAAWHDTNPKTVLSPDGFPNIPRNQAELKDGRDVLAILAGHPGTARNVCAKLCRRLIADSPPTAVVDAAVATWMATVDAPDQLRQVVRTILLSDAFRTTWGGKVRRPFDAIVAYLRAAEATLPADDTSAAGSRWNARFYNLDGTGHRLFEWPTPTGYPDVATYWSNTNGVLRSWNLPYIVVQSWGGDIRVDHRALTNMSQSCVAIVDAWIGRLCGTAIAPAARAELIAFLAQGGDPNAAPRPLPGAPDWNDPAALTDRLGAMVQLLAMTPDFYLR